MSIYFSILSYILFYHFLKFVLSNFVLYDKIPVGERSNSAQEGETDDT